MTTKRNPEPVDLDLDALRASGADGKRTKTFKLDGQVFTVPAKPLVYFAILMGDDRSEEAFRLWLGDEQWDVLSHFLTDEDFEAIFKGLYGSEPGESQPSAD